jgi:DNA mismatch repair ATPase MutS
MKMLYACIKYLSANNGNCFKKNAILSMSDDHFNIPLTFVITHLTQLMTNQLIEENYYVRYLTMDVNNDFDFLFKLKPGLVKSGYGIKSAEGFIKS